MFVSKYVYVVNLDSVVMTLPFRVSIDIRDTMRYKDVTDWLVIALTLTVDADAALGIGSVVIDMLSVQQRPHCLCQMLHLHQP